MSTLDALSRLSTGELERRFAAGITPQLDELEGMLDGRLLVPGAQPFGVFGALSRRAVTSALVPWDGKRFRSLAPDRGEGVNRLFGDRLERVRFRTSIGPSVAGDFSVVILDYDVDGNPHLLRRLRDELRRIDDAWLGVGYLRMRDAWKRAVFFALERHQRESR
jgi:hypothetical protein